MNTDKTRQSSKRKPLTFRSPKEAFQLDLQQRTMFTGTNIVGGPVPGCDGLNTGILPEPYHAAAKDATYGVTHYGTPIAWLTEAGTWLVPMHSYGNYTSTLRNKLIQAIEDNGETVEKI